MGRNSSRLSNIPFPLPSYTTVDRDLVFADDKFPFPNVPESNASATTDQAPRLQSVPRRPVLSLVTNTDALASKVNSFRYSRTSLVMDDATGRWTFTPVNPVAIAQRSNSKHAVSMSFPEPPNVSFANDGSRGSFNGSLNSHAVRGQDLVGLTGNGGSQVFWPTHQEPHARTVDRRERASYVGSRASGLSSLVDMSDWRKSQADQSGLGRGGQPQSSQQQPQQQRW
jgi:hypothetical protein